MRRPGGAVTPAMKLTTGFFVPLAVMYSAASSSAVPESTVRRPAGVSRARCTVRRSKLTPDLANHDDPLRLRIVHEALQAVDKVGAVERVASDTHAGRLAESHSSGLEHLSIWGPSSANS